ncbi:MAG: hypothetical protein COA62_08185 [Rhodobiaceae bacterium]|nr:MAG: hypothetical protein COA62_08185 [Rhodobiaceae bacterium]
MIRNFLLSAVGAAFVMIAAFAVPTDARADTASDIAAILADGTLTVEQIATQVAELVVNAEDPSAATAVILAAVENASATQLEGVGAGLGKAVALLQQTDATEASEVALEVVGASEAIQTAFEAETGTTASILAAGAGSSLLGNNSGNQSAD